MSGSVFLLGQIIFLLPALALLALHIYLVTLAIKALRIYINKNS